MNTGANRDERVVARDAVGQPTGNYTAKNELKNKALRRVVDRFDEQVLDYVEQTAPESLLDVGCGEGRTTLNFAQRLAGRPVVGLDLNNDGSLTSHWSKNDRDNLSYVVGDAARLPFADDEFDMVAAIEIVEHVDRPDLVLGELSRVARRHLLVSVPREPLWRILNVTTGRHVRSLGNTPGHVNHWGKRGFKALVSRHADIVDSSSPIPWTIVLASCDRPRNT